MRGLIAGAAIAVVCFAVMVALTSCTGSAAAQSAQDQKIAQSSVQLLNSAWQEAAKACLASGQPACRQPLETAYGFIQVASQASDGWGAASAGQYACALGDAAAGIVAVFDTLNVAVPPLVATGLDLVKLVGSCPASAPYDAGGA